MLEPRNIISVIEAYRTAFWAHKDLAFITTSKYKPLVCYSQIYNKYKGDIYAVFLYDTWMQTDKPGHFYIGRRPVAKARFFSNDLQTALEELLQFTKQSFVDDEIFNKIRLGI